MIQQSRDAALIELLKSHLFAAEQFISQQTTETRIMKESLLAITTFIPGNSYDSSLKRAQQQLTELRRVWLQEHENNKSLRLNSFKNQKNFEQQQYEYLELRQEFDKVTSMVEELLDEIEDRECT